jgi:hypothetical protein
MLATIDRAQFGAFPYPYFLGTHTEGDRVNLTMVKTTVDRRSRVQPPTIPTFGLIMVLRYH